MSPLAAEVLVALHNKENIEKWHDKDLITTYGGQSLAGGDDLLSLRAARPLLNRRRCPSPGFGPSVAMSWARSPCSL